MAHFMSVNVWLLLFFNVVTSFYRVFGIEVTIADGRILGRQLETENNKPYFAFQDIRYAKPPIDSLRFQEPVPAEKWEGVLDTTENRKVCVQFGDSDDPRETEDCLVLNVYTPVDPNEQNESTLPVMVWIHGGSFLSWFGTKDAFGPDYFIDQNVVVVTLNYRLGPLGFLTTGDSTIPANNGLKDQLLALKWVNKNIEIFGGDPTKVTLAGQSAGAAAVGYHVMSKKSSGLFRAAIMQSASPLICWALQKNPEYMAKTLGSALKWKSKWLSLIPLLFGSRNKANSTELLKILQKASIEDLKKFSDIKLQVPDYKKNCHSFTSLIWTPAYESADEKNAMVTGMNHENMKNGDINKVPILIGINSQESLLFGPTKIQSQCALFDLNIGSLITQNMNIEEKQKVPAGNSIKQIYTNTLFAVSTANSVKLASDLLFATPVARQAHLNSRYSDVYFYQFSHKGKLGQLVNSTVKGAEGVAHQEEIEYLFRTKNNWDLNKFPEEDIITHYRMVELWAQFIKHMNPTQESTELLQHIVWPQVSPQKFSYLNINSTLSISEDPKNYNSYRNIYEEYAEPRLDTY